VDFELITVETDL